MCCYNYARKNRWRDLVTYVMGTRHWSETIVIYHGLQEVSILPLAKPLILKTSERVMMSTGKL